MYKNVTLAYAQLIKNNLNAKVITTFYIEAYLEHYDSILLEQMINATVTAIKKSSHKRSIPIE